ncbi:Hypothetical protein FKW44_004900 [Caligus rogercresseyi]|uniref:Uncharacterized protein n=1 Tax=Caligus rogercresseyi TaxID=217165 RepID=A0A7T8KAW5_CALRO|nr:Hypothetical protein FKW44_004900 [Caligus rogercresseyi]
MGHYPSELLARQNAIPDLTQVPQMRQLQFSRPDAPQSIVNAMREHQAMLDAIRDGLVNKAVADTPDSLQDRAHHIKGFAYFSDAAVVGICELPKTAVLNTPIRIPILIASRLI